ncbi:MAG: type II toxin-antitoxin system prevent-host-death family antitoxin [Bifidobacteriaceae bacterium]|nr:type II toxin-antitoxin system prevent-host-death family antitoxin [Bifidobacteriaceae bacterium]
MTRTMNYSQARANFAEVLDSVIDHADEVIITRAGHQPAVVVSLAEWESLRETAYLMRSPVNAQRLTNAIADLEAGHGTEHGLIE